MLHKKVMKRKTTSEQKCILIQDMEYRQHFFK